MITSPIPLCLQAQMRFILSAPSMPPRTHRLLDRIGTLGSLLCAVHCAALPLAIALLPSLGVAAWLGSDAFEFGFVVFATLLGAFSLAWGYRRHGEMRALGLLVPGLLLLWAGAWIPELHAQSPVVHAVVMTTGGVLVALAHWANLRLNHGHVHGPDCAH